MENIQSILTRIPPHVAQSASLRPVNTKWEQVKNFLEYLCLSTDKGNIVFVLGLCKRHGFGKVMGLKSWLKDASYDASRLKGLLVWKLSQK